MGERINSLNLLENCTAVILTGGESRRMGRDKAMVKIKGKAMVGYIVEALDPLFSDILISVREYRSDVTLPQIIDSSSERGPMIGINSALQAVQTDWLFVIACDMPFVCTDLIHTLALKRDQHEAVLTHVSDRPQPLFGFYAKSSLPLMQRRIAEGQRSMMRLLDELDVYLLPETEVKAIDPELKSLMSLDREEDIKKMELSDG